MYRLSTVLCQLAASVVGPLVRRLYYTDDDGTEDSVGDKTQTWTWSLRVVRYGQQTDGLTLGLEKCSFVDLPGEPSSCLAQIFALLNVGMFSSLRQSDCHMRDPYRNNCLWSTKVIYDTACINNISKFEQKIELESLLKL